MGYESVDWILMAQGNVLEAGSCENSNEPLGCTKLM
jgi:hypothetical protein